MKKNTSIVTVLLVITAAGVGFFGGMKYTDYQRSQMRPNGNRQFPPGANGQIAGRGQGAGRPVVGEVIAKDETSLTVKTQDGGSRIVIFSDTTTYSKTSEATIQDVVIGTNVGVFGTENSDKSVTAQNIQLNPQFRMNPGTTQPAIVK